MSNILKVTTSIGGYDNSNTIKQNPQMENPTTNIQGPVNPDKVVRPDARSDSANNNQTNMQFKYETNFDSFLQQLKNAPVLAQELPKIFQEYKALFVESGIGENYAEQINKFLNMIDVDSSKLHQMIKTQGDSSIRFTGSFFSALRQIMNQTKSVEVKTSILLFLKKYTDMTESEFVLNDIKRNLSEVKDKMFPQQREQLSQLEQKINYDSNSPQNMQDNLKALKEEIFPFINKYITDTHERGSLRDNTALISQLIARYENGSKDGVMQSFERLMDFQVFKRVFKNFDSKNLFQVLQNTEFEKASNNNKEMQLLAELLCKGAKGEAGIENKAVFNEILKGMVLNESVYMPLLHFMIPLSMEGRLMFSQVWIDPDADRDNDGAESDKKTIKGLIKFDIQDLGFFDLFFVHSNEKISLRLNVPPALEKNKDTIQSNIDRIFSENSIKTEEIVIGTSEKSIPITQAFDNLIERKKSVNVTI